MNPNHYLAVAIHYLLTHRPAVAGRAPRSARRWSSSSMIDRVVARARPPALRGAGRLQVVRPRPVRRLALLRRRGERGRELPPARRHRVDHRQGRPDHGPARGRDHRAHRQRSGRALPRAGRGVRRRPTTRASTRRRRPSRRRGWRSSRRRRSRRSTLAGEPIAAKLTRAPGNGAPIGGLKVVTASGWFAARPSGTENIYKIYAESFRDRRISRRSCARRRRSWTRRCASRRSSAGAPGPRPP